MNFVQLESQLEGDLYLDHVQRVLYSTDASQYKELPLAVTRPKSKEDLQKIIAFATQYSTSAILAFRDEYPELVKKDLQAAAGDLAGRALLFEEFISAEIAKGNISESDFTSEEKHILLHGHCQQKAIASTGPGRQMLSLPANYTVKEIPSGCCGMAGSFGYEKEHYELSMKIGELVLFPAVREAEEKVIISAPGTSCRHHIKDGTGQKAFHPVEVLYNALI
jgi:Fe-S oxidoreductase